MRNIYMILPIVMVLLVGCCEVKRRDAVGMRGDEVTQKDGKLRFVSRENMNKVIVKLKGMSVKEVANVLAHAPARRSRSYSGNYSDVMRWVEKEIASSPDVANGPYKLRYAVSEPREGVLFVKIENGIVREVVFLEDEENRDANHF